MNIHEYQAKALLAKYGVAVPKGGRHTPRGTVEPLVLRANAGDCISITLENRLPMVMPDLTQTAVMQGIVKRDRNSGLGVTTFSNNLMRPSSHVGLHAQLLAYDITKSDGASLSTGSSLRVYANSRGFMAGYPSSHHSRSCVLVAGQDGAMQRDYWFDSRRDPSRLLPAEQIGEEARKRTLARLGAVRPATGDMPVLFSPRTASARRTRRPARDRFGSVSELLRIAPAMVPFVAIIFLEALCAASFYRLGPVRINEVGGDAAMLGLGATLAAFIEVPFMIASARMLKGIGLRRGFAAATAIMGVITASVALFDSALSLTLLRLAEGAVFAIALMCAVEVVDRLVPRRLHATGQSLYHSAGTLGAALGGIVAGVLYDTAGSTVVFVASGVGLLITALFALRTIPRGRVLLESDATHGAA